MNKNQVLASQNAEMDIQSAFRRVLDAQLVKCIESGEKGQGIQLKSEDKGIFIFMAFVEGRKVVAEVNGVQKMFHEDTRVLTYNAACDWVESVFYALVG